MAKVNLNVIKSETFLILTDTPTLEEWQKAKTEALSDMVKRSLLAKIASEILSEFLNECQVKFHAYPSTGRHGSELDANTAAIMLSSDAVVAITTYSLTHTSATKNATEAGVRVASMPAFVPEMLYPGGPMNVDYRAIAKETTVMSELMATTDTVSIKSSVGTDITFNIKGRKTWAETGIITKNSSMKVCNLPAGEASVSPLEGTAEGVIVVEAGWYPGLSEQMAISVTNGKINMINGGGEVGKRFNELMMLQRSEEPFLSRRNIAEFGVGSNPNARRLDIVLEAEKIKGTVHIGMGSSFFLGGKVKSDFHSDLVIPKPVVTFDDKVVIDHGKWVI